MPWVGFEPLTFGVSSSDEGFYTVPLPLVLILFVIIEYNLLRPFVGDVFALQIMRIRKNWIDPTSQVDRDLESY